MNTTSNYQPLWVSWIFSTSHKCQYIDQLINPGVVNPMLNSGLYTAAFDHLGMKLILPLGNVIDLGEHDVNIYAKALIPQLIS